MYHRTVFCAFTFEVHRKCKEDSKSLFCKKINVGIKNEEFYTDFKLADAGFKNAPQRSYDQKP
jgi:hypothetical protein